MIDNRSEYDHLACVYEIRCTVNGKVYVGQTKNLKRRIKEHICDLKACKHRNHRLQDDYNKFGKKSFEVSNIHTSEDGCLDELERAIIEIARNGVGCYNVFSGGLTGYVADDSFREKLSKANKGKKLSDSCKEKMSEATKKQWQDKEYRRLMVQSAKTQWTNNEYRKLMRDIHTGTCDACGHKLTADIVISAREAHANGVPISELASMYGVKYAAMRNAVAGRSWKFV